jgi:hypothetical protein
MEWLSKNSQCPQRDSHRKPQEYSPLCQRHSCVFRTAQTEERVSVTEDFTFKDARRTRVRSWELLRGCFSHNSIFRSRECSKGRSENSFILYTYTARQGSHQKKSLRGKRYCFFFWKTVRARASLQSHLTAQHINCYCDLCSKTACSMYGGRRFWWETQEERTT